VALCPAPADILDDVRWDRGPDLAGAWSPQGCGFEKSHEMLVRADPAGFPVCRVLALVGVPFLPHGGHLSCPAFPDGEFAVNSRGFLAACSLNSLSGNGGAPQPSHVPRLCSGNGVRKRIDALAGTPLADGR
jgi:hypothetical protein